MFTGIVEGTGEVLSVDDGSDERRVRVATDLGGLERGQSVAVDGVCLTVEEHGFGDVETPNGARGTDGTEEADESAGVWFSAFLSRETLQRTTLSGVAEGDRVNLERAMPADGRFDGHLVQGHVDGTGEVLGVESVGEDWWYRFSLPADLARYVVEKGSIAVDGISLTVADVGGGAFAVAVVPETHDVTSLSDRSPGDPVNLEVDVLAKYVERQLEGANPAHSASTRESSSRERR